jgi:hypothetical protein
MSGLKARKVGHGLGLSRTNEEIAAFHQGTGTGTIWFQRETGNFGVSFVAISF